MADEGVHGIFRHSDIRRLVQKTIREATVLAEMTTDHAAAVLRDSSKAGEMTLQVMQKTVVPGKWRLIIEKDLGRDIGQNGERILRVVLDMSGRVVTAFPVKAFTAAGITVAVMDAFTERVADAAEAARPLTSDEGDYGIDWGDEVAEFFNPLYSGSSDKSEGRRLRLIKIVADVTRATINDIEEADMVTLSAEERDKIRDMVWTAVLMPQVVADDDGGGDSAQ